LFPVSRIQLPRDGFSRIPAAIAFPDVSVDHPLFLSFMPMDNPVSQFFFN